MDIRARIGYDGQEIYAFTFPWTGSLPEAVTLTGNVLPTDRDRAVAALDGRSSGGILGIREKNGQLEIRVVPFPAACAFTLTVDGKAYTAADGTRTTLWADEFLPFEENGVRYGSIRQRHRKSAR